MTCADTKKYLEDFLPLIKDIPNDRKIVIAPPFTAISTFSNYTNFDYLNIASQNIHWEDKGAFTAEISPTMLIEHKVQYAIVGHSEPRKYFSEEDVIKSAKIANAHEFILKLPLKYETKITERGSNFSGGQIQRLAIARAILGNPSILLLDEATSALDSDSEAEVQKGLNQAMNNRTVVVVAHRLSTIQGADKIVIFDKGKIIDIGKHIDLFNKNNFYKELCEKQFIKIT